jgi:hypothetical protein
MSALKSAGYAVFLITSEVLDARRQGATTEAYGPIRRKPAPAKAGGEAIEGNAADDALMVDQGTCSILDTPPCLGVLEYRNMGVMRS